MNTIDLTQRPPRSARTRLGGYVLLPRMLDKCRATLAGKNGDYHYDCPLDQHILKFAGVEAAALQAEVATGKGDGEILEWITANSSTKPTPWEIAQWSAYQESRGPSSDAGTFGFFSSLVAGITSTREDITTWADMLDLDDYVTFGGKA